jgi:serine/threonine protein kinase
MADQCKLYAICKSLIACDDVTYSSNRFFLSTFVGSGTWGSVGYKAPELHVTGPYSNKIDVFSFGATIYRLLLGDVVDQEMLKGIKFDNVSPEAAKVLEDTLKEDPGK